MERALNNYYAFAAQQSFRALSEVSPRAHNPEKRVSVLEQPGLQVDPVPCQPEGLGCCPRDLPSASLTRRREMFPFLWCGLSPQHVAKLGQFLTCFAEVMVRCVLQRFSLLFWSCIALCLRLLIAVFRCPVLASPPLGSAVFCVVCAWFALRCSSGCACFGGLFVESLT
jgi:hypothetical protein